MECTVVDRLSSSLFRRCLHRAVNKSHRVLICTMFAFQSVWIVAIFAINAMVHTFDNRIFCSDFRKRENYTFHPLRHCQRSNMSQISARNVNSFEKCAEFAKSVKALAFNYGRFNASNEQRPRNLFEVAAEKKRQKGCCRWSDWLSNTDFHYIFTAIFLFIEQNYTVYTEEVIQGIELYNCEALACPETANFSTIVNDTRFDYYSLYANPPRKFGFPRWRTCW